MAKVAKEQEQLRIQQRKIQLERQKERAVARCVGHSTTIADTLSVQWALS